ncbi:dihydroorotase family protein [Candidatus Roizmanbacteria bacterium]|nr:dihydroorotase family protein [Candidatus Roizmanbacteria bacterium]
MKKLIKNGKIVTREKVFKGNILINEKGKIENITTDKLDRIGGEIYDAKGSYILPGLIEVHGHLREPGLTLKEDIPHGTRAALAGGFTTVIDMPNTKPPTVTVDLLKEKINKIYAGRSYVDYAFFMGASSDKLDELEKVNPKDIAGIKVFMAGHETTPTTIPDDKTLGKIFQICTKRNIILALHAEDQWLINYYKDKFKNSGRSDPASWSEARPKEVIITAVGRAIALAEQYGTKVYLLHLATPEEFTLVNAAKKRNLNIYGELVSYQLIFNTKDYKRLGNLIKVSPALRSPQNQSDMWNMFNQGLIDAVCSEHTPHEWESKNQPDVWKAQSGTPGIQETLPALVTEWSKRFGIKNLESGLMKIALYASYNPAKIFGFKTKGAIEVGKDADLVIIDIKNKWQVKKKDLFSKCGWSAYEDMKLIGKPSTTFLRGKITFQREIISKNPSGKWINH